MYSVYISRLIVNDNKYFFLNIHSLCKHIKSNKQQTIKKHDNKKLDYYTDMNETYTNINKYKYSYENDQPACFLVIC